MTTEHKHDTHCCHNHHEGCIDGLHHHDCCGEHATTSHCCQEKTTCCGGHCKEEGEGCCQTSHAQEDGAGCCASHQCCEHHHHHGEVCGCGGHHHGAYDVDQGLTVQFSGEFEASIETVWQMLTDNAQIKRWFPELAFETLEPGGTLRFNYSDGGSEEMMILDVEAPQYLSFTWDINIVTFELTTTDSGNTLLIFTEWLSEVNDHSPKDLTGWMICLQNIAALIEGKDLEDREEKFHELYPRIKEMLAQQSNMEFED